MSETLCRRALQQLREALGGGRPVAVALALACVLLAGPAAGAPPRKSTPEFDGKRAIGYLNDICKLGPRWSGSAGMHDQQQMLGEHFRKLGGRPRLQRFRVRHPQTAEPVTLGNLVVEWHPRSTERILIAAHYDTRPYPDRDARNPRGTFIGANDGASGVAIMMELAHRMSELVGDLGVDFVLFDAEEFVFRDADRYFLGSEYFAHNYVTQPPAHRYVAAVVLDMVGDTELEIYQEAISSQWEDTKPLIDSIWKTAAKLGVREFVARAKYEIRDDHLALRNVAGIPACDIIDFDYPNWHTEGDLPERCSAASLQKVGWVVETWLRETAGKSGAQSELIGSARSKP